MSERTMSTEAAQGVALVGERGQERGRGTTTRMFESDFLERMSRIHPATPFVVWLPIITFFVGRSLYRGEPGALAVAGLFLVGVLAWTLTEYVLHRWVFHWTKDTPFGRRFHFLVHGVHHDYPNDKDRLVMPLGVSIPLGIFFYTVFRAAFGVTTGEPFFAGFVFGYLGYDGVHYAVHHFAMKSGPARWVKRHHMLHHHADHDGGFGVSSPLWDLVFRTMPMPQRRKLRARAAEG
jgi:sterol desaturase/sphingolipid hydroxylase (fatty acid hydroxylase superfamily)